MRALVVALVVASALSAGCSGGSSPTPRPSTSTGHQLIRGNELSGFSCAAASNEGVAVSVIPSSVTRIRLCPLVVPNGQRRLITITASDPLFAPLIDGLSLPDAPRSTGACPAYADVPQQIIGKTGRMQLLIHIPVDGCDHYLSPAVGTLTEIRNRS